MNKIKRKERVQLQDQIRCVATQQDLEYSQNLRTEGTLDQERPKTFWPHEGKGSEPETARSRKVPSGETKMDRNDKPCSDQKGPEENSDASVHRTEKRRRSHDSETQGSADTPKKPKYIPKPKNGLIDRHIYMADMMAFYKLDRTLLDHDGKTDEQIKRDTQKYRDGVKDIEDGWEEYKKNMLDQGYTELQ
ncbi:uncharacterized protein N7473_004352 [Penicillium subrubescens]|uniref:Uncharacterized protein n=1 Tax=Penicillium subrubescens TaxID=1316194 RepID=A0A1Q5U0Q8_9EURO|nr:uncharacterized protein N7473_004352 [Penicillium subrubescens]KAJ5900282.1 hypothetical protein N7473_004352 [Penicillium subrubescens]OKP06065.1 hypothetical protein PENSUB_6516 [Penicillium subrubescens]